MRTIWKYPIPLEPGIKYSIKVPRAAKFRHLNLQAHAPCLWLEVDSNLDLEIRGFVFFPTGGPIPIDVVYIGTILDGLFAWHLYEVT